MPRSAHGPAYRYTGSARFLRIRWSSQGSGAGRPDFEHFEHVLRSFNEILSMLLPGQLGGRLTTELRTWMLAHKLPCIVVNRPGHEHLSRLRLRHHPVGDT